MDNICAAFSKNLENLMLENNVSVKQMSRETGISGFSIAHWRKGNPYQWMPSVKNIVLIANYFDCSVDFLIGKQDNPSSSFNENLPPFSQRFSYIVSVQNINLYRLAKTAGFSSTRVFYDWRNGKKQPNIVSLTRVSDALHLTVDELLGRTEITVKLTKR